MSLDSPEHPFGRILRVPCSRNLCLRRLCDRSMADFLHSIRLQSHFGTPAFAMSMRFGESVSPEKADLNRGKLPSWH